MPSSAPGRRGSRSRPRPARSPPPGFPLRGWSSSSRGPVAGNWTGRQGYTSGLLPLGTPPEKDVGYPYAESWGPRSPAVTAAMTDYSWQRHLIARDAYADWVDRGRLRPTHRQWSFYLRGVAEQAEAEIVAAEAVGLEVDGERWRLAIEPGRRSGPTA